MGQVTHFKVPNEDKLFLAIKSPSRQFSFWAPYLPGTKILAATHDSPVLLGQYDG